ncbi:MAG TPA: histidine phosphatase family protein [Anaerolineales bacterium]|nr:histidine phosphatase family protein [Anaerolineales bacterium]
MTSLLLLRHGVTQWNQEGRYQGQADPPLDEDGRREAGEVAARLQSMQIDAVHSSDLRRAVETARIIAERLRREVKIERRLREVHQGSWEGLLVEDIPARYPLEWAAILRDPLHARPPGGESLVEVAQRVGDALDEIAGAHPSGTVLIVSHGLALAAALCRARDLPLEQARGLIPGNSQWVEVEWPPKASGAQGDFQ